MKVILIFVVSLCALVSGQFKSVHRFGNLSPTRPNYSQYRAKNVNQYKSVGSSGQYSENGQYRADVFNRDDNNNGRYVPDDSGKYIHMDQPYGGGYGDKGNRGGYYSGDDQKYHHVNGPTGSGSAYKNSFTNSGQASTTFQNTVKKIPTIARPFTAPTAATNYNSQKFSNNNNKNYAPQQTAASRFRTYGNEGGWRILRQDKEIDPVSYSYAYETENKIIGEEIGRLANAGGKEESVRTSGFYEYEGDDGKTYRVEYTADENGFVPKGAHIPEGIEQTAQYLANSAKN